MQYLLHTHVILWWFTEPKKLSSRAQKIIKEKSNKIFLSSVSFWEMAIKKGLGRLTIPHNFIEVAIMEGFEILPIMPEECLGVADLPLLHADPFDRLLIMQAKLRDLVVMTKDPKITEYPIITLIA